MVKARAKGRAFAVRTRWVAAIVLVALVTVAGAHFGGRLMAPSTATAESGGDFDGLWRSRGYGWIWSIEGKRIRTFDVASRTCFAHWNETRSLREYGLLASLDESGDVLRIRDGDATYEYVFDRIDALPDTCGTAKGGDPVAVFDAVDDHFSTHYPFFAARGVDWRALVEEARASVGAATSDAELFQILTGLLSNVPDDHVSLEGEVAGQQREFSFGMGRTMTAAAAQAARENVSLSNMVKAWYRQYWRDGVAKTLLGGRGRTVANDLIQYGLIDGDIGYLNIRSLEGLSGKETRETAALDKALDKALDLFGDARAVIVDVSLNDGGFDFIARQLAGRFAEARTRAYSKRAGDDPDAPPQDIYIEPSEKRRYTGPVFVLTSELTVSAAEVFAIAMRALPNVTHVGEATRGALSDSLYKPLPNGWWISLSNEVYLDVDGMAWEGRGIRPEVEIEVFSKADVTRGHPEAVRRVIDLLKQG